MKEKTKIVTRNRVVIIGVGAVILPFIGILIAWVVFKKSIYDNPDFWYGYMAYLGTVLLATVALYQNVIVHEINESLARQELRKKIGYFELEREVAKTDHTESGVITRLNSYCDLRVGGFVDCHGKDIPSKQYVLRVRLKNVGEDIICNMKIISERINGEEIVASCSNKVTYKNEIIAFDVDIKNYNQTEYLDINLDIQMENVAGIKYNQNINVKAKNKLGDGEQNSGAFFAEYVVTMFDTSVSFVE